MVRVGRASDKAELVRERVLELILQDAKLLRSVKRAQNESFSHDNSRDHKKNTTRNVGTDSGRTAARGLDPGPLLSNLGQVLAAALDDVHRVLDAHAPDAFVAPEHSVVNERRVAHARKEVLVEVYPGFDRLIESTSVSWFCISEASRGDTYHDHADLQHNPEPQKFQQTILPTKRSLSVLGPWLARARHVVHVQPERVTNAVREEGGAEARLEQRRLGIGVVGSRFEYTEGEEATDEQVVAEDVHVFPVDARLDQLDRALQNGNGLAWGTDT